MSQFIVFKIPAVTSVSAIYWWIIDSSPTITSPQYDWCTSWRKSSRVLALHACVLQESGQYSPSALVNSGIPRQGSVCIWCLNVSKIPWRWYRVFIGFCVVDPSVRSDEEGCNVLLSQLQLWYRSQSKHAKNSQVANPTPVPSSGRSRLSSMKNVGKRIHTLW